jgi:hypothetical protein
MTLSRMPAICFQGTSGRDLVSSDRFLTACPRTSSLRSVASCRITKSSRAVEAARNFAFCQRCYMPPVGFGSLADKLRGALKPREK